MVKNIFFVLSLFLLPHLLYSITISGYEPNYAGRKLSFKTYKDPVSKTEIEAFFIQIDNEGYFTTETEIQETNFFFCNFDTYRGLLILQPGSSIKINLPTLKKKSLAEEMNPYFQPVEFWFSTESNDPEELTGLFSRFENRYNQLTNEKFNQLYINQTVSDLQSVTNQLKEEFSGLNNPYFKTHIELKLKLLEAEVIRINQEKILNNFITESNLYNHYAFINILDGLYSNKLSYEIKSVKNEDLKQAVYQKNLPFIKQYFSEKYEMPFEIIDIILLKLFHDAYYSGDFTQNNILDLIHSDYFTNNQDRRIQLAASSIIDKITFLKKGTQAPLICLNDPEKIRHCTDEAYKYKYILFIDLEIAICREHLKYAVELNNRFEENIQFYIIYKNPDEQKITDFFTENNIPGIKLNDYPNLIYNQLYKIRSYPYCFLLDQDHSVLLAPAKAPLDGFEFEFENILLKTQP